MAFSASQMYVFIIFISTLARSTVYTTYAIYYVIELGMNPLELVIVGTVMEVTVLVFEGITGVVADTYSRRISVIAGMFVLGVGFLLEGSALWLGEITPLMTSFLWILIAQVVIGIGCTFISGADTAWIVDEVGEENAGHVFMRAQRFSLLAALIGISLSVVLSMIAPNVTYIAGGFLYLSLGVFLIFFMKETGFVRSSVPAQSSHWQGIKATWLEGAGVVKRHPVLFWMLIVTLFSGAASEGYDRLWEAYLMVEITFPNGIELSNAMWFGLIAMISTLLSIVVVRLAEKRLDMGSQRMVSVGMFVLTVARIGAIMALALAPNFTWALLCLLSVGIIGSLSGPIYVTWLNQKLESRTRATVLSMINQSDALGQTAGGPGVGWIGQRVSIRVALLVAALLLSPLLVVFGNMLRKGAQQDSESDDARDGWQ